MPEREPTSTRENLEIEFDGETHRGQRVVLVVSDTEVRQEVRYRSLRRVDPDVYAASDAAFMRAIANEILWRLVAQWKAETPQPPKKPKAPKTRASAPRGET